VVRAMHMLLSVAFWLFFSITSIPCFAIAVAIWLVSLPFDPQGRANHLFTCAWARLYTLVYPGWKLTYVGREKIDPRKAFVLVSNHASFADIILLYGLFRQFKWVSKHTVFYAPLVGWNMYLCRYVSLVRGNEQSVLRMMEECRTWLRNGMPVMLFPEGTRSKDGSVAPFKHGAFTLALDTGIPVLPIALHGTHAVLPKHGATVSLRADLEIEVLDPVPPEGFSDPYAYGEAVRRKIRAALGQDPIGAPGPTPDPAARRGLEPRRRHPEAGPDQER